MTRNGLGANHNHLVAEWRDACGVDRRAATAVSLAYPRMTSTGRHTSASPSLIHAVRFFRGA